MAPIVKIQDVVNEIDTISSFSNEHYGYINNEYHGYLNRQTGELVTISNEEIRAVEEEHELEDYPNWQQEMIQQARQVLESDDYLPLPSKFDIYEYSIIEQFCYSIEDAELSNELLFQIQGSGAFQRFKHAIHRYNLADDWYSYRQQALEQIAIDWLKANSIPY
ncbi:MAG: hypothetical protein F6J92_24355 [Symploca sp. SIO1A3]|nr:hypothetical protein [Symploca sp. SIO1A3]